MVAHHRTEPGDSTHNHEPGSRSRRLLGTRRGIVARRLREYRTPRLRSPGGIHSRSDLETIPSSVVQETPLRGMLQPCKSASPVKRPEMAIALNGPSCSVLLFDTSPRRTTSSWFRSPDSTG